MNFFILFVALAYSPVFANKNNFSFIHNFTMIKGTYFQILKTIIPSVETSEDSGYMNSSIIITSKCKIKKMKNWKYNN